MFAHRLRKTLGAGVNNFYRDEHFTPVIGARRATFRGLKRDFAELIRPRQESSNRTGLECCTAIQIPLLDVAQADSLRPTDSRPTHVEAKDAVEPQAISPRHKLTVSTSIRKCPRA